MGNVLGSLKPELLWNHFEEICNRPHPSRHEGQVAEYILEFAKANNLESAVDDFGNIIVRKPATAGKENLKSVVLQGHLDMVPEKNNDVNHNFEKDPLKIKIDNGWVTAEGTTLGSDNGIGVAAALAVLEATDIEHGPIEALFTLDEETGLFGAQALKPGFVNSRIMLNMDSEEDGALYIGCAGGQSTHVKFTFENTPVKDSETTYKVTVKGLKGGHSGLDIDKGYGNAVKMISRVLWEANKKFGISVNEIEGGSKHNAIPRESFAKITVKAASEFEALISEFNNIIKAEYASIEKNLEIVCEKVDSVTTVMDDATKEKLLNALYAAPHGVIRMHPDIPGLVQTSTNLATIHFEGNKIALITSQRSSAESEKFDASNKVTCVFRLAGAETEYSDGYPGWNPNVNSDILTLMKNGIKELFGHDPEVKAIHAGLECGIIMEKYEGMDTISFGPTITGAHSPDERVEIETVEKFWNLLLHTLKNIPSN
ncbi:MAG: aminoacyl-histidine dipeptidase [Bacteroidetes bacterium]|nr:aminoacyl-histidine dipeptidase [Bacteroidota bacterium]